MMHWKTTGKVKALIVVIFFILNFVFSKPMPGQLNVGQYFLPLIFGAFMMPLVIKMNALLRSQKIEQPCWNDNPFRFRNPLIFNQFAAWFMIASGSGMILGTGVIYLLFNSFGLLALMFGLGILIGVKLTVKWFG